MVAGSAGGFIVCEGAVAAAGVAAAAGAGANVVSDETCVKT